MEKDSIPFQAYILSALKEYMSSVLLAGKRKKKRKGSYQNG
jgi:hypothetical protein